MKLEDLKAKRISDLLNQIVDQFPADMETVNINRTISEASPKITNPDNPTKMVVAVDDNQQVKGVLTGFDIAKALQTRSVNQNDTAERIMNPNYVGVELSDTFSELALKLGMKRVDKIVVTDHGKYIGIIERQKLASKVEELLK